MRRATASAGVITACIFLALQVVWIFVQLRMESRYFSWAMFHSVVEYRTAVEVNGLALDDEGIVQRYRIPAAGREYRSLEHLKDKILVHEERYGGTDRVNVHIDYVENHEPGTWIWSSGARQGSNRP